MAQHKFRLTVLGILVLALVSLLAITACAAYVAADHGDKGEKGEKSEKGQKGEKEPKETPTPTITPTPTPTNTPVPTATPVPSTPTPTPTPVPPPDDSDDGGSGGGDSTSPAILSPEWGEIFYAEPSKGFFMVMDIQSPSDATYFCSRTSTNYSGNYPSAPVGLTVNDACQVLWTPDTSHVGTRYEVNARADFRYSSGGSATHYVQFYVEVMNNPPPPSPTPTPVPPPGPAPTPAPTPPPDDPCASSRQDSGIFASLLGFLGVGIVHAQQCVEPPDGYDPDNPIHQKWLELKEGGLDLGWPETGGASLTPSPYGTSGQVVYFPAGNIYQSPLGIYEVHGDILSVYQDMGEQSSQLGFPVSDEYADPGTGQRRSDFEGGSIAYDDGVGGYKPYYGCGEAEGLTIPLVQDQWNSFGQEFAAYLGTYQGITFNGHHGGEDRGYRANDPVKSIGPGKVVWIGNANSSGSSGKIIVVEHTGSFVIPAKSASPNGNYYEYPQETVSRIYSVYMHVIPVSGLSIGQCVGTEQIATLDSLPDSSLPTHLHLEIRHPNQDQWIVPGWSWVLVGTTENRAGGGYYKDPQLMVDDGLRDPSEVIAANP